MAGYNNWSWYLGIARVLYCDGAMFDVFGGLLAKMATVILSSHYVVFNSDIFGYSSGNFY